MSFYDICFFFIVYSVIGWIVEVIFHASVKGVITNRGFLNGPVCPVYGFGVIAVLLIYEFIGSDNFFVIFLEGIILTTSIELFAGFILDKFFHARWWDYSNMPYNLNGYICLAFSIIWGLAIVFAVKICHPFIAAATVGLFPINLGISLLLLSYLILFVDTFLTVSTLIGLNKNLAELDTISKSMRLHSDKLSTTIGESSLKTTQLIESSAVQYGLAKLEIKEAGKEKLEELEARYNSIYSKITKHKYFGVGHIISAFPNAKHRDYHEVLLDIQRKFNK